MKRQHQRLATPAVAATERAEETVLKHNAPLSPQEQQLLIECESILRQRQQSFLAIGQALAQIRNSHLYRQDCRTFAAYCRKKWRYGKTQVYALIAASDLVAHLSALADILPQHETQVRPLVGSSKDQALAAWQKALTVAAGKPVTAHLVKAAAAEFRSPHNPSARQPRRAQPFPAPEALAPLIDQLQELLRLIQYGVEKQHYHVNILGRIHELHHHFRQLVLLIL